MATDKKNPWRWRKVRPPSFAHVYQKAMEAHLWHRSHAGEIELVRGGVVYATVKPSGQWVGYSKGRDIYGNDRGEYLSGAASDVATAKQAARAAVEKAQDQ